MRKGKSWIRAGWGQVERESGLVQGLAGLKGSVQVSGNHGKPTWGQG